MSISQVRLLLVSGSGNVAIYAVQKATAAMAARLLQCVTPTDISMILDGIKSGCCKRDQRSTHADVSKSMLTRVPRLLSYTEGKGIWTISHVISHLPCATQNELDC